LYFTLFPQLVAGPIVTFNSVRQQIKERTIKLKDFAYGIDRFMIGLGKKVLIANNVSYIVDDIFNKAAAGETMSMSVVWLGVIAYAIQLYFDFSGYSDMAVGLGRMLGFTFIENFNYPYISKNIQEFWRRWNISLGNWFRDYVYIPLGGSRVSASRVYFNYIVVFFLTGFWHGASWNFVVWGLWNVMFILIEKAFLNKLFKHIWAGFQHIYAIVAFLTGWVFFRADNLEIAIRYIKDMFSFNKFFLYENQVAEYLTNEKLFYLVIGIIFSTPLLVQISKLIKRILKNNLHLILKRIFIFTVFVISIFYLVGSTHNPFIYFRF